MSITKARKVCESCKDCRLGETRTKCVFGEGSGGSGIMFVGEGPGENEDKTGLPFVGKAGDILNTMLAYIGLSRNDVYITNIVKCRPPKNRVPLEDEVSACFKYLKYQIKSLDPTLVVLLGKSAANLFGIAGEMHSIHGRVFHSSKINRDCFVVYHPASCLYSPGLRYSLECDFSILMDHVHNGSINTECINHLYTVAEKREDILEKIVFMPSGFSLADADVGKLVDAAIAWSLYKTGMSNSEFLLPLSREYVDGASTFIRAVLIRVGQNIVLEKAMERDPKFGSYLCERGIGDKKAMVRMLKELGIYGKQKGTG